uniref:CCHC-type domain-containing protein n=1 Tax=Tanacetum cinerariifolium TaxID=118510 RepID=A0A699GK29_TANCI|nr:hypothetical protein [Tanacetum cinerariifolium]
MFQRSRDDKNGKSDRKCFRCGDPNHLIGECLKPPKDKNQRAFIGGSWSDRGKEDDESDENSSIDDLALDNEYDKLCKMSPKITTKNKRLKATRNSLENELRELKDKLSILEKNKGVDLDCAKCHAHELKEESTRLSKFEKSTHCLNEMLSNQKPFGDKLGLGFNSFEASSSGTKKIKFMKAQKKTSSDGGLINIAGPQSVHATPKIIIGPPPATSGSEKTVSFQKSIFSPRPKHIIVNKVKVPVASDNEVKKNYNPLLKPRVGFSKPNLRSKTPPPRSVNNNYSRSKTPQPKRHVGRQNQPHGFPVTWNNFSRQTYMSWEMCLPFSHLNQLHQIVDLELDEWIKDSRCSKHMTGNRKLFSTYKSYNGGNVICGSNLCGNIIGKGQICDNKCRVTFSEHDSEISKDGKVIGYSQNSKAYIILNKHTKKIEESLNVTFDETPPPYKTSLLVDDDLDEEEVIKVIEKKNLENDIVDENLEIDEIVNIKESRNHPLENVIENLNQRTLRNKLDENGIVSRNKARLVAQGYNHQEGINYDETYAPKALYGLKQAPKAWYDRLKAFLIKHEYKMGMVDNTLFTKKKSSNLIIVQIYVDDIIFGSTCQDMCDEFAKIMHDEFEMSMMGELNFFLGLQIKQIEDGTFFNQSKNIKEMLNKFGLEDSKPMKTPMSSDTKLTKDEECELVDSTKYRGMVGSLLYLTTSRPAIMFSVCICARFQKDPNTSHLEAVKLIFRYIKCTTHLGLWYPKGTGIKAVIYADSDHAGDYVNRKSTSGICTFVRCCLTSWFSKKQTALAISTTEAEYVSTEKACRQALWMKQAFIDYDIRLEDVSIMCDNKGAIDLSKNPTRSDHGKKRPRKSNANSSSATQDHPSSSLPPDAMIDENDDESSHPSSFSPSQQVSSSYTVVSRVRQNHSHESHILDTFLSETITLRDAHRDGLRKSRMSVRQVWKRKTSTPKSSHPSQNDSPPIPPIVYLQSPSPPSYNPLRDQMINQLHNIFTILDSNNNPSNVYIHAPPSPPPPPQIHPPSHTQVELHSSFCHCSGVGRRGAS